MSKYDTVLPIKSAIPGLELRFHTVTFGETTAIDAETANTGVTVTKAATGRLNVDLEAPALGAFALVLPSVGGTVEEVGWQTYTEFDPSTRRIVLSNAPGGVEASPGDGTKLRLLVFVDPSGLGPSL